MTYIEPNFIMANSSATIQTEEEEHRFNLPWLRQAWLTQKYLDDKVRRRSELIHMYL